MHEQGNGDRSSNETIHLTEDHASHSSVKLDDSCFDPSGKIAKELHFELDKSALLISADVRQNIISHMIQYGGGNEEWRNVMKGVLQEGTGGNNDG